MKSQQEVEEMRQNLQAAIDIGKRLRLDSSAITSLESFAGILDWVLEEEKEK